MTDDIHTQLAVHETRVAEAERIQREAEAQYRQAATRLEELTGQLAALSVSSPDQLDATGTPKRGTAAAKLAAEAGKLKDPPIPWAGRLDETRKSARWARSQLDKFEGANVEAIVKAEEPLGRDAGAGLNAAVNVVLDEIDRYQGVMAHFSARVSKAQGLNAQVELPGMFSDKLSNLRRDLQKFLSEIVDPLPRSIFPRDGEAPPRVQTADGGWVSPAHVNVQEDRQAKREQQEQRDRTARRRVPIHPPQPQPTGRSKLDETLNALLGD